MLDPANSPPTGGATRYHSPAPRKVDVLCQEQASVTEVTRAEAIHAPQAIEQLRQNGFVELKDFLSEASVQSCKEQGNRLYWSRKEQGQIGAFPPEKAGKAAMEFFHASSKNISLFNNINADGSTSAVPNKLGHALHGDPVFARLPELSKLATLLREMGMEDPVIMQSMLIFKPAHEGDEVSWHQDRTFTGTDDEDNLIGLWIALDEATEENGSLVFKIGEHFPLTSELRNEEGFVSLKECDWSHYPEKTINAKPGDAVLFTGTVPHSSPKNTSHKDRWALTFHCIDRAKGGPKKGLWIKEPFYLSLR